MWVAQWPLSLEILAAATQEQLDAGHIEPITLS